MIRNYWQCQAFGRSASACGTPTKAAKEAANMGLMPPVYKREAWAKSLATADALSPEVTWDGGPK